MKCNLFSYQNLVAKVSPRIPDLKLGFETPFMSTDAN